MEIFKNKNINYLTLTELVSIPSESNLLRIFALHELYESDSIYFKRFTASRYAYSV